MATGMTLGMEDFVNVTAENAKVISDGSRYIVVGYGMPGLTESLGLDEEDIQLPDYFEVEADAVDFKLGMTITVASVETLGEEDIDLTDAEKEINDLAGEYQDGMNSLVDGISEYTSGVDKVNDGVNKLSTGSEALYSGAGTLKNGMDSATSGAEDIKDGLDSAYSGSKSISDGAAELNEAVQGIELPDVTKMAGGEVDDATKAAIKSTAESKLGTDTATYVGNAVTEVVGGSVNSGTVKQVVDYNTSGPSAVQTAAQNAGTGQAGNAADKAAEAAGKVSYSGSANVSTLTALKDQIAAALKAQSSGTMDDDAAAAAAEKLVNGIYQAGYGDGYGNAYCTGYGEGYAAEYQNYLTEFDKYISQVTAGFSGDSFTGTVTNVANAYASAGSEVTLGKVGDAMDGFSSKLDTLKAGTSSLASGTSQLTSGLSQLDTGAGTLEDGMTQLKSGTDTLYSGTKTLNDGVGTLKTGTNTLSNNSGALKDGATQLQEATDLIVDKLNEKEDGINQFVDNVNSVKAAARDYQSFGGASGDMVSKTKFIIKLDGINENVE